jgi:hypothetical protein
MSRNLYPDDRRTLAWPTPSAVPTARTPSTLRTGQEATVTRASFCASFVELIGIEPTTSGLQSQRSPN